MNFFGGKYERKVKLTNNDIGKVFLVKEEVEVCARQILETPQRPT